ncbi:MAG: zinc-ribbon domain containing protein [Gammaproteobacteria bacterium]|nr:zinc-ribbon domain containing protein [Gammaproteobacteria bacterium]MDH3536454.1 zinc-ribbon domain containing protein [Gammaproteobacteria bacterium]
MTPDQRKVRRKNKAASRLPVDASKLNMGNTYSSAPDFYYDIEFDCIDCGAIEPWSVERQKWRYQEARDYFFATAVRCRSRRAEQRERRRLARSEAGHAPA